MSRHHHEADQSLAVSAVTGHCAAAGQRSPQLCGRSRPLSQTSISWGTVRPQAWPASDLQKPHAIPRIVEPLCGRRPGRPSAMPRILTSLLLSRCVQKVEHRLPTVAESGPTGPESGPTGSESGPTGPESGPTSSESGPTGPESGPTCSESGPTGSESVPQAPSQRFVRIA